MRKEVDKLTDLGLTYMQAGHGVQTAIAFDMETIPYHKPVQPKHMRTGIDMGKSDMLGLACLLMDKGVITPDEYDEYMRRAANHELAVRENEAQKRAPGVIFR